MYRGIEEFGARVEMAFCETIMAMQRLKQDRGDKHLPEFVTAKCQLTNEVAIEFVIPLEGLSLHQESPKRLTA